MVAQGLFTAPTDIALKFDIEATLAMGFSNDPQACQG